MSSFTRLSFLVSFNFCNLSSFVSIEIPPSPTFHAPNASKDLGCWGYNTIFATTAYQPGHGENKNGQAPEWLICHGN